MKRAALENKIGKIAKSTKTIAAAGIALTVGVAGALGVSTQDDTQDSVSMPGPTDEQQTYDQINSELDQTEQKLKELDRSSNDTKETDYALMGC